MSFVKYEPQGSIAYLIIDREKALNALNTQVHFPTSTRRSTRSILTLSAASSCAARAKSPLSRARTSRR